MHRTWLHWSLTRAGKALKRSSVRRITDHALDLFDSMQALELRFTCQSAPCASADCHVCAEWWQQQRRLHDELKLRPWEYPAYSNFKNDDPQSKMRYRALNAASDARMSKDITDQ